MRDRTGWPDRVRLPVAFDPELLARDLAALESIEWIDHFLTDRYEGTWDVIPLRGPAGATHTILMIAITPATREFADTPMLEACPYFRDVISSFRAEVQGVRLLRLTPGSRINEHTDHGCTGADGVLRLHIPVVTNPDVIFTLNGTRVVMEAGSAWYLALGGPHSVANNGSTDRVHMIVDTVMTEELAQMVSAAAYLAAKTVVA